MTEEQVRTKLRRACDKAASRRAWGIAHDVAPQYIHDVLRGGRPPGPRILAALGLVRVVSYRGVRDAT